MTAIDTNGATALHKASSCGMRAFVELLLNDGADMEVKDRSGRTPFDAATQNQLNGSAAVFDLLRFPTTRRCCITDSSRDRSQASSLARVPSVDF